MIQLIDAPVIMRDGVRLSADIRYPDSGGPFPAILIRTAYDNSGYSGQSYLRDGYAVVKQDCRGRFDSEGRFDPLREDADGHDTIAWLTRQPWCNGNIGLIGSSYSALTQLAAAWTEPEGLKAIAPAVIGHDGFKNMIYQNGVFNLSLAIQWGCGVAGHSGQAKEATGWDRVFRHLPLNTMDKAAGYDLPYFREWLSHGVYDNYWAAHSVERHFDRFNVPAFHIGGWYDVYSCGILRNFRGMKQHGGPLARRHQKIIVGPWIHGFNQRASGQLDFGETAVVDIEGMTQRWMDRWVKGVRNNIEREPPVRIFVMGENTWRDEKEWPLARTRETNVFLSSGGRANSLFGDGALSLMPGKGARADHYAYNPDNPVPTLGGACLCALSGPTDHAPIERRDDVLVFTGEPLKKALEVTGFVKMIIFVSSNAVDTDFVARLCDVYPDGRSIILCDGIARARFREGLERERMITPGRTYELEIDMGVTSNVFLPGHCLRLEVTSSCFPRWARNLNTGEPVATATRMKIARQTIYHSSACPSRLRLPVIPR